MLRRSCLIVALTCLAACDETPVGPSMAVPPQASVSSGPVVACGDLVVSRSGGALSATPVASAECGTGLSLVTASAVETAGGGGSGSQFRPIDIALQVKNGGTSAYDDVIADFDVANLTVNLPAGLAGKDVVRVSAGAGTLAFGSVAAGSSSETRTLHFRLHAGVSQVTIHYTISATPGVVYPTWCNTTLDFNGGILPDGWYAEVVRGGPGLANDRVEGRPNDSGAWVISNGALPPSTSEVEVNYDASILYTFWGMHHGPELLTATGGAMYHDASAAYNFGANNLRLQAGPLDSPPAIQSNVPFDYADYHVRVVIRNSGAEWTLTRLSDGSELTHESLPYSGLSLADVTGFRFWTYTTTDNMTWSDNVRISCR